MKQLEFGKHTLRLGGLTLAALVSAGLYSSASGQATSCVQFEIEWVVYSNAPPTVVPGQFPPANIFSLESQSIAPVHPPMRRGAGSRYGEIVIVGVNASGSEIARTFERDPRGIYEDPRDGRGGYYHRSQAAMMAYLPADSRIVTLRIYETLLAGSSTQMNLLGSIPVAIP